MAKLDRVEHEPGITAGGYRPQLAECRERLRDVSIRSGGTQVASILDEAKQLRARLVLASGLPLGASSAALIPAAVAIELLHLASLVHDDIIDEATERRGVPALHVAAGRDRALVVGDVLIVSAFEVLGELRTTGPPEVVARSVELLSKGAQRCCLGQLAELDASREAHYLEIVAMKTGALFSTAASLGAIIAGAGVEETAALALFGTELGSAYQIGDDLRDGSFSPTIAAYAGARDAALAALARTPEPCRGGLRALADAMLSTTPA